MFGLRDRYDLVMGIGGSCSATIVIRSAGLQFVSMPLDWAGCYEIHKNVGSLVAGFRDIFVPSNLVYESTDALKRHDVYRDRVSGMGFFHDVPHGRKLDDVANEIAGKYERRAAVCMDRMSKSRSALLVFVEIVSNTGMTKDVDLLAAQQAAQNRFPGCQIDLLFIYNVFGRKFDAACVTEPYPHIFKIGFDISIEGDLDNAFVNHDVLVPVMRQLVPGGALDYRTAEQKRAFRLQQRQKKLARLRARNGLEYLLNSVEYRLYKKLRRMLEKRGFAV